MSAGITLATVFLSMSLGPLASSLTRITSIELPTMFFIGYFVVFRIKGYLDDLQFVKRANPESRLFIFNFFFALLAWFWWMAAAVSLENLSRACFFILLAFVTSTVWIVIDWWDRGWRKQFGIWFAINAIYIVSAAAIVSRPTMSPNSLSTIFAAWIFVCLFDMWKTGNLPGEW